MQERDRFNTTDAASDSMTRRDFVKVGLAAGAAPLLFYGVSDAGAADADVAITALDGASPVGGLKQVTGPALLTAATWYEAAAKDDGLTYAFPAGHLQAARYLTADLLLVGRELAVFYLTLREGADGRAFRLRFGLLNQCSARLRMPLSLVDMNRWRIEREGAWLKPTCAGQRVDLAKVDRATLTLERLGASPVRWCMTPLAIAADDVAPLAQPILPRGPLIDELGQSTLHDWPGKSHDEREVVERIRGQAEHVDDHVWPAHFAKWGGWRDLRFEASGYFRTHHDGRRWWLVDPEGYAFWSAGLDCVRGDISAAADGLTAALRGQPQADERFESVIHDRRQQLNYLGMNFIRAVGADRWRETWWRVAHGELNRLAFNTVGNWSEWEFASQWKFPYVRPLRFRPRRTQEVYRDFPDVFAPEFAQDAADYAQDLERTAADPALVGYFMMNEPTWGFSSEAPAVGMLWNTPACATREQLARFLRARYADDAALAAAWGMGVTADRIAQGPWKQALNETAERDLAAFSEVMVTRFFGTLADACRRVDSHHLNLGIRYASVPPAWALEGMRTFDVFSMNCYQRTIPGDAVNEIQQKLELPTIIGEWHFGALDVGLPATGIGRVATQADRGRAYRVYFEDAAAHPNCVGVHWFTMYDQSALGRFDGEHYNIGFFDVCNRPYPELCDAAKASHAAMYAIASGAQPPFADAPEYLPRLFL